MGKKKCMNFLLPFLILSKLLFWEETKTTIIEALKADARAIAPGISLAPYLNKAKIDKSWYSKFTNQASKIWATNPLLEYKASGMATDINNRRNEREKDIRAY